MKDVPKLGQLATGNEGRDAIHVAVIPVQAGESLTPGQHVRIVDGKAMQLGPGDPLGVVDPFLRRDVIAGDWFWLCLYPQTITSLRHEWTHPAFPAAAAPVGDKNASTAWLMAFCNRKALFYDTLLDDLAEGSVCAGDDFGSWDVPDEFWYHVEVVTGRHWTENEREGVSFRCAC